MLVWAGAFARAVELGGEPVAPPETVSDGEGRVLVAVVKTFGDTVHSLVERDGYAGSFLPGFRPWSSLPVFLGVSSRRY